MLTWEHKLLLDIRESLNVEIFLSRELENE